MLGVLFACRFYLAAKTHLLATMMTFDTGTWGAVTDASESAAEKRRREREEREAELLHIKEEEEIEKKKEAEERRRKEERWAREAAEREKENRQAEARRREEASKATQAARAKANAAQTEAEKIEAALAEVRRKKQERSNAMQRAARETLGGNKVKGGSGSTGSSSRSSTQRTEPRGRVRVNPVTGALETIAGDKFNDGKVQEGCMRIDKKYMNAALAAGLGAGKGMYGHIGTINKQFTGAHNTGARPSRGPQYGRESAAASTGRASGGGSMSRVKVENGIATITSKTSNPRRQKLKRNPNFNRRSAGACDLGGNPIRGDQKRPPRKNKISGINKKKAQGRHTGGYMREKGVVATLGGATSGSSQRYQAKKAAEKEAARQQERLGSRPKPKPRRQAVSQKLGGGSGASAPPANDAAARREARLAALAARGL